MRTLFVIKVYIQTEDMMGNLWRKKKKNEVFIFCTVANRSDESEYFQIAAAFFQWWMRSNYKSLPAASWECCLVPALLFFSLFLPSFLRIYQCSLSVWRSSANSPFLCKWNASQLFSSQMSPHSKSFNSSVTLLTFSSFLIRSCRRVWIDGG